MASPGWYPDPGGQPGLFRYWDGRAWSAATTANPHVAAPPSAAYGSTQARPGATRVLPATPPRRGRVGWTLAVVAAVVVVAVGIGFGVWLVRGAAAGPVPERDPVTDPTPAIVCPPSPSQTPSALPDTGDARVVSGHLSYPRLAPPFTAPQPDPRTPFGRDVRSQTAEVEEAADGRSAWVAAVLIARLLAGDGFYGPQQGAQVVAQCVVGKFYGDNPVEREDLRNEATSVDGHDAWIIEMHLTFDIPGIETKGEAATIVVVDTGAADGEAGLFYSSIPDTSPEFVQPAAKALKDLRVS